MSSEDMNDKGTWPEISPPVWMMSTATRPIGIKPNPSGLLGWVFNFNLSINL